MCVQFINNQLKIQLADQTKLSKPKLKQNFQKYCKKFQLFPLNTKLNADKQKLLTKKLIKLQKKIHMQKNYHSQRADAVLFGVHHIKKSQLKTIEYNYQKNVVFCLKIKS